VESPSRPAIAPYGPYPDIVDIKPVNMEELTEVITSAEFHPIHCNLFMYSSSKSNIKLADMRDAALCDRHAKSGFFYSSTDPNNPARIAFLFMPND